MPRVEILKVLVQAKRNTAAALKLMRKLLKKQGIAPTEWVADKERVDGSALRDLGMSRQFYVTGRRSNNQAEVHTSPCDDVSATCKVQSATDKVTTPVIELHSRIWRWHSCPVVLVARNAAAFPAARDSRKEAAIGAVENAGDE